ncbi:MAG: DNA mismatch repair protein MutS [Bacteroidetes bacterium]|nr:DNA mismatch repair protein MutS [Bacteroidota bacterium]
MKIYQENIEKYNIKALRLQKLLNRISLIRFFIFVISIAILITLISFNLVTSVIIVLPISIICFAFVLKYYNKIAYLRQQTYLLKKINESEVQRDICKLEEFNTGHQFSNQSHPYTSDLDIFGQHSIFQLINRTTTESGMTLLSKWLSEPASNSEINDRQKAIKELSQKFEWRQDFQASGMQFQNKKSDYNKLLDWVETPVVILKHLQIYIAAVIILPLLLFINTHLFYVNLDSQMGLTYLSLVILVLLTIYIVLRKVKPQAEYIVETSTENLKTLRGYRTLINKIEGESFNSKKLQELQSILIKDKYSAHDEINTICQILEFSHQRPIKKIPIGGNYLYPLLNNFFLIDIYLIIGTEKWKTKNKAFLKSWAEAISEFEVINSFAGFYYSNPSYTFPEITENNNYVYFESLGHPLINSNNRVCNDYQSDGYGDVIMITGSNMAGKSTFLRTVGVNIALALAGAPCCAKNGKVSNLKLFTSMRTQDNLEKGISSFYAELNRIEKMLKLIESNQNIFFLLDEMFKGTNSEDRHKGGFSLINQLSKLKTSGIIATHDIELAKLTENRKIVKNYSFNSEMIKDSMIFNYKLHNGICFDFNASELMKKSGIEILTNIPVEYNQ